MFVHFTPEDLTRVRIVADPEPMWETVLSVHALQHEHGDGHTATWRASARAARQAPAVATAVRALIDINPRCAYFPDFLTPLSGGQGLDAGIDAVLRTPKRRMHAELATLSRHATLPGWVRQLDDNRMLTSFGRCLRTYHGALIAPLHHDIAAAVRRDRAHRAAELLAGGVEQLLAGLAPGVRWNPPVLQIPFPVAGDLHLRGRGLTLVPSYFCDDKPVMFADHSLPPVLVYRARRAEHATPAPADALQALLGGTRAAVLLALSGRSSTGDIARHLELAPSSVSEHIRVLRDAGLVGSTRRGAQVIHLLTPRGWSLLDGAQPAR